MAPYIKTLRGVHFWFYQQSRCINQEWPTGRSRSTSRSRVLGKSIASYKAHIVYNILNYILDDFQTRFRLFKNRRSNSVHHLSIYGGQDAQGAANIVAELFQQNYTSKWNNYNAMWHISKSQVIGTKSLEIRSQDKVLIWEDVANFYMLSFGSTYLRKSTFSYLKMAKNKYRSSLTDQHIEDCLKFSLSTCSQSFSTLKKKQRRKLHINYLM